jgi:ribulose-phosphate 3-epimerase
MSIPIVPAVIPKSESEVIEMTKLLRFSHEFHLDVVDGKFVQSVCWPYSPEGEPLSVKAHTDSYTLEVDLMVEQPTVAAKQWVKAGADMLIFHIETIDLASFEDLVTYDIPRTVSVGVSFNGDTPIESLFPYMEHADYIQVMGIHTIGLQGQPFAEVTFEKIRRLKEKFPHVPISVDGSVNETTIARLAKAGVDRLIVGSAIVKQEDKEAAYKKLRALVDEA